MHKIRKRGLLSPLFYFVLILACATSLKKQDIYFEMDGFRGIKWGMSLENVRKEMIFKGQNKLRGISWYQRKNEKFYLGDARLSSIIYIFQNKRLVAVNFIAKGRENFRKIKRFLENSLGKPSQANDNLKVYSWRLPKTIVLLSYAKLKETTFVILRNKEE